MLADHAHEWTPIAGVCARYSCWCGVAGHRRADGKIRESASTGSVWPEDLITARPTSDCVTGRVHPHMPDDSWGREQDQETGRRELGRRELVF